MERRKKIDWMIIFQIAVGTVIGLVIADFLGLKYAATAGVTTLLTIQSTKKETIRSTIKRYAVFVIMLISTYFCFEIFGYKTWAFGIALFFILLAGYAFSLEVGLASNVVLATHFLAEGSFSPALIANEFLLLLIGSSVGVVLNIVLPKERAPFLKYQEEIDEKLKRLLHYMALRIEGICVANGEPGFCDWKDIEEENRKVDENFRMLESRLDRAHSIAEEDEKNRIFGDNKYIIAYFAMRRRQTEILRRIWNDVQLIETNYAKSVPISVFFQHTATHFYEENNVKDLLEDHKKLEEAYRKMELPKTRREFEDRALLFVVLTDIKNFLLVKKNFRETVERSEKYR